MVSVVLMDMSPASARQFMREERESDPMFLTKFCFVKNELLPEMKISTVKDDTLKSLIAAPESLVISNASKSPIKLLIQSEDNIVFTKALKPNHLPVTLMIKERIYQINDNGFKKENTSYYKNPMAVSLGGTVSIGISGQIKLSRDKVEITQKEWDTFIEIPLQYYFGDTFIENKILIRTTKDSSMDIPRRVITKLEFSRPLPKDLSITSSPSPFPPEVFTLYSALKFTYKGQTPLLFIKDFTKNIEDHHLLQAGFHPFHISQDNKCYRQNPDPTYPIPENERKKFYDEMLKSETELLALTPASEEDKYKYLATLKDKSIHYTLPLGHKFPGNGSELKNCEFVFNEINNLFSSKRYIQPNIKHKVLDVPADEIVEFNLWSENKMSKFHLIKRTFVNTDWAPDREANSRSNCSPYCPQVIAKEQINHLADVTINYPTSNYKNEDLVCHMTGNNGHSYREKEDNDNF